MALHEETGPPFLANQNRHSLTRRSWLWLNQGMLQLRAQTSTAWAKTVLSDLDAFLVDHAANERKASANALSLVSHYPDRPELVEAMIALAQEELEHFAQVHRIMAVRNLQLAKDQRDPYVRALLKKVGNGSDIYFLDRLLLFGVVEARGCERFGLLAEALEPGTLKDFYQDITRSEARHHGLFHRLAKNYFSDAQVKERLDYWLDNEAEIIKDLPLRPALH